MATRSGGISTAMVGKLTEARQALEAELQLPVASRMGPGNLSLMVSVRDDAEKARVEALLKGGSNYRRFPVEIRQLATPQKK